MLDKDVKPMKEEIDEEIVKAAEESLSFAFRFALLIIKKIPADKTDMKFLERAKIIGNKSFIF